MSEGPWKKRRFAKSTSALNPGGVDGRRPHPRTRVGAPEPARAPALPPSARFCLRCDGRGAIPETSAWMLCYLLLNSKTMSCRSATLGTSWAGRVRLHGMHGGEHEDDRSTLGKERPGPTG